MILRANPRLTAPYGRGSLSVIHAIRRLTSRDQRKRWMHGFLLVLPLFTPFAHAERWKVQYFYDELKKSLYIEDLAFPTASRGIAVGTIIQENSSRGSSSIALLTSDGGVHWTEAPLKDHP